MKVVAAGLLALLPMYCAELKPETARAFDKYVREVERRLDTRHDFLWSAGNADRASRVRQGEIVVETPGARPDDSLPGGLAHDWVGAVFLPGATIEQTLAKVQDYGRHQDWYKPEVIGSRLLSRNGDDFRIEYRLLKKKVITVVLETEHEVHYTRVDRNRWISRSYSTKIAEVQDAGKPDERALPPGAGHGFLWKLNSYWRFEERDGGTWVECEALSLTRDVPAGLGWIIDPIVRNLPRESLLATLHSTRVAVTGK